MPYVRVTVSLHPAKDADLIAMIEASDNASALVRRALRKYAQPDPELPPMRDEPREAVEALDELLDKFTGS